MNDIYSIQENTLTSIGDSLRRKFGETKIITVQEYLPLKVISKTSNATGPDSRNGDYENNARIYDVVNIPGAVKIEVSLYAQTEGLGWDWVQVAPGALDESNFPIDATKYGGQGSQSILNYKLIFEDTDTITFYFHTDGSTGGFLGYYAECIGYDADGNVFMSDELSDVEREVFNDYSPLEMSQAIDDIPNPVKVEPIVLTGDCSSACKGVIASSYIEKFGDTISTNNITAGESMFYGSTLKRIPFDINFNTSKDYNAPSVMYLFGNCKELEELPNITGSMRYPYYLCGACYRIREIPESWATGIDWSTVNTYTSSSGGRISQMFQDCYSLRRIPEAVLKNIYNNHTTSSWHGSIFSSCYTLDEIVGFRGTTATMYNNQFASTFQYCYRVKRLVFDMDNGQPRVQNWKNQSIDLASSQFGYVNQYDKNDILNYNSGITADKEVIDDATYQALKNDPDWFSCDYNYSRYNRISAVETINSLPDTSAYLATSGGTNNIRFKGDSGALTDGGAINTMTEEEIAVAAAKGWTVSFS